MKNSNLQALAINDDYFAQVNALALSQYPNLLYKWFPAGHLAGHEFECGNLNGAPGKSFKVNVQTGKWADFATGDQGGDPVSLVAYLADVSQGEAARLLARMLGIETGGRHNG